MVEQRLPLARRLKQTLQLWLLSVRDMLASAGPVLLLVIAAITALTALLFSGSLRKTVPLTVISDRAGLVMEDGAIVEQGNHAALMKAEGAYYRLYMSQFAGAVE